MDLLLRFDPTGAWLPAAGDQAAVVAAGELASLAPELDKLRDEIRDIDEKILAGEIAIPPSKQPLGTGFVALPAKMLAEYEVARRASELGKMLAATKQLMTEVDRVVVLGDPDFLSGPRALMGACCQPYFNELTRGERGSRPRMIFVGDRVDNDAAQGLLYLLGAHQGREASTIDQRWALVVLESSKENTPVAYLQELLVAALRCNCGGDEQQLNSRILSVTAEASPARRMATELRNTNGFSFPDGVCPRYSVLSMAGLLPAALLGINIMKLLEGARAMSQHFHTTPAAENMVLQLAGINHIVNTRQPRNQRLAYTLSDALTQTTEWYRQLLSESLGNELLVRPPTWRPLAASQQSPQVADAGQFLLSEIVVDGYRFDPLPLIERIHVSQQRSGRDRHISQLPSVKLSLPQVDEPGMGQLLQLLMLATVVEGRLVGRNPFS